MFRLKLCNADLFSSINTNGNIANGKFKIITIAQAEASNVYATFIWPAGR